MIGFRSRTIARLLMCLCALATVAFSQTTPGTITGVVTDPEGAAFPGAFVVLKNTQTAAISNLVSAAGGNYTFAQVTSATYELSVNVPGMQAYQRTGIIVEPGQTVTIDARLEDSNSLRTLGEDPASIAALYINRPEPPTGPAPRALDGKPDLSGMWLGGPAQLPELHMLPWAEALTRARKENNLKELPISRCLPAGPVPLLGPGFFKLVQTPTLLVLMFEDDTPGYRQVFLDGRSHPKDFGPTWLGHSIGKWEGDTLVIDSIGFNDKGWLYFEGQPHDDKLHVTQRIRRFRTPGNRNHGRRPRQHLVGK
jgi:Carboxypeptidase regulatory-like domain